MSIASVSVVQSFISLLIKEVRDFVALFPGWESSMSDTLNHNGICMELTCPELGDGARPFSFSFYYGYSNRPEVTVRAVYNLPRDQSDDGMLAYAHAISVALMIRNGAKAICENHLPSYLAAQEADGELYQQQMRTRQQVKVKVFAHFPQLTPLQLEYVMETIVQSALTNGKTKDKIKKADLNPASLDSLVKRGLATLQDGAYRWHPDFYTTVCNFITEELSR